MMKWAQGDAVTETDIRVTQKDEAYQFLKEMQKHLNANLPSAQQMGKQVRDIVVNSITDEEKNHLRYPDAAFTNHFLIPHIFDVVSGRVGKSEAQQCMLSEYRIMRKVYCGQTSPQRLESHP